MKHSGREEDGRKRRETTNEKGKKGDGAEIVVVGEDQATANTKKRRIRCYSRNKVQGNGNSQYRSGSSWGGAREGTEPRLPARFEGIQRVIGISANES